MATLGAPLRRVRRLVAAWFAAYLPRVTQRRPAVQLELRAWVPGWALRLALGALALGCASLVVRGPVAWILLIALSAAVVVRPSGVAPAALVLMIAIVYAARGPSTGYEGALLLLGLHALAQWAVLVGRASWTAEIEIGALSAPLPRFLGIQAFVQPLALLGGWLTGRAPGLAVLPLLAVFGLALLTYVWLPRLATDPPIEASVGSGTRR